MSEDTHLTHLARLEWIDSIRDPIWGEIPITEVERRIIQTRAFYRLRGIKQLGFSFLTFVGASHTRFEHSLGVMHVTDMLIKMTCQKGNSLEVIATARQILRLAALLHDIGHPPFSHAMESLFKNYPGLVKMFSQSLPPQLQAFVETHDGGQAEFYKHEFFTEYIISTNPEIRNILFDWLVEKLRETHALADAHKRAGKLIDQAIARLAVGKDISSADVPGNIAVPLTLFKSILGGDIDADKIDYLMRDNHSCGMPYSHDLDSLREQLVITAGGLKLRRGALKFIQALLLARYRLITEVHHEIWDVFATSKAIELLHDKLAREKNLGKHLLDLFTRWNDSMLLDYLAFEDDPVFPGVLTRSYPLKEIARLDYLETHPSIRGCIDMLSEPAGNPQVPVLQDELRMLTGNPDLTIHIHQVKLPEFSMKLGDGGGLLGDAILRGISEESVAGLRLVVLGKGDLENIDLEAMARKRPGFLPCESCDLDQRHQCIGNLKTTTKTLLAELVVRRYRSIVEECGSSKVTVIDFLMLLLEKVCAICQAKKLRYPTRQQLYLISKHFYDSFSGSKEIFGSLDLKGTSITSSFHQQLRKYEQLGLIAYEREIRRLESEDGSGKIVFRFDRRFHISRYGAMWLDKIKSCFGRVKAYEAYKEGWDDFLSALAGQEEFIAEVLTASGSGVG